MAGNNPIKIFASVLSHYINLNTSLLKYNCNALTTNYFRMCSLRLHVITKTFIPPQGCGPLKTEIIELSSITPNFVAWK